MKISGKSEDIFTAHLTHYNLEKTNEFALVDNVPFCGIYYRDD